MLKAGWVLKKLMNRLSDRLAAAGSGNAKRAAEELAAHVLGCKPTEIYFREFTPGQERELEALIARAEQGEPIQYIIGHVDFQSLKIHCDPRALIPRPETELLVQAVLDNVDAMSSSRSKPGKRDGDIASTSKIADVGTGTGCVALAILAELPNAEVTAIDISADALELARENAERLGLSKRFVAVQNDLLEGVEEGTFDIIVANLPYIASEVCTELDTSVREHEPVSALDGGADGLDFIRRLTEQAVHVLKSGGQLYLEIGYDQGPAVQQILADHGFQNIEIKKDLAGLDRIVTGKKN